MVAYNLAYIGGFFIMHLKKIDRTYYYYSGVPEDLKKFQEGSGRYLPLHNRACATT
jgi:hypothetical protein